MIRDIPDEVDDLVLLTFILADEIDAVDDLDKFMTVLHKKKRLLYYHFKHLVCLFVHLVDAFELKQHCDDLEHLEDCHLFSDSQ